MSEPVIVGLTLPPGAIPGLNRATELLRLAYPCASDGELLEHLFVAGICATIDRFSTLPGARPTL